MAPPPGPYSGTSTLALVVRASAFTFGVVYGSLKLKVLKIKRERKSHLCIRHAKANSQKKAEAKAHH
ncbi:unnamed protein product, partial [Vitis vinifera]|uniref:Uncharacterized protein n=1 Tax=Vitis vinifera TaxID=29760 RepID=E0CPL3_VITVI